VHNCAIDAFLLFLGYIC